uniref:Uncharacterized protein n=1 Tax=Pinguiococcus pyrenoidosus TaxID=172671 RepID=A0A7R9YAS8_9STRA
MRPFVCGPSQTPVSPDTLLRPTSTMATPVVRVETEHEDMIHDAQLDYYSRLLATASSDRSVRVFDVSGDMYQLKDVLSGHEGPVWQVAWSHPKFGMLASCSYDGSVRIYREQASTGKWEPVYVYSVHKSSVNSISFAPHELGLVLACASADGEISVLTHHPNETVGNDWKSEKFADSPLGVNTVCWAPFGTGQRRFVTGGCDNKARIWSCGENGGWSMEILSENAHSDWVRDVAWAPSTGLPHDMIATASEDRTVRIWTKGNDGTWGSVLLNVFDFPVWRVSWSITGNILAVSAGDSDVTLWKQSTDGSWARITSVDDEGVKN